MAKVDQDEQFVEQLTGTQDRLYAYILTLVGNRDTARDILQEANVVLWRRRGEFEMGTNFSAWAYKVSHFQVMAFRRDRGRDRHWFSDDVIAILAEESAEDMLSHDDRHVALERCMASLSERHRWLIEQRYKSEHSISEIADELKQSDGAVSTAIYRVRNALRECVLGRMTEGTS
jgi:RNA polymerase sigma-70 factor (ECF subfamily)